MGVAVHLFKVDEARARNAEQAVAHAQKMLADNEQFGIGQQMVDVGDPAGDRIVDRDHAEPGRAVGHRGQRVLEGGAGERLHVGKYLAAGDVGIRARLALKGDFLHVRHGKKIRSNVAPNRHGSAKVGERRSNPPEFPQKFSNTIQALIGWAG